MHEVAVYVVSFPGHAGPRNEAMVYTYCYDYEAEHRPEYEQQWPLLREDDVKGNRQPARGGYREHSMTLTQ